MTKQYVNSPSEENRKVPVSISMTRAMRDSLKKRKNRSDYVCKAIEFYDTLQKEE